ncbi:MAG TPA: ABC transporter permease [Phycisphaerales bacterium]|nr:ABC transporter permease [Phycisphaerales bacterium]
MKIGRNLFGLCLVAGLGVAVTLMLAMLAAQVGYAGGREPIAALGQRDVQHAIRLSVVCATIAAMLAMVVAIPSAYVLARYRFPGHTLIDALLDIPIIISPVAIGMTLLLMFRTVPGSWVQENLIQFVFAVPGIILAQFILALALQIRVMKASFEEINPRLEQVARYLGCGPWSAMWRVTLPLAKPGLIAAFVLGWGRAIGDYGATVTIAGSVKGKTDTIPIAIFLNWSAVRIEAAVALVMVLTAIALLVLLTVRVIVGRGTRSVGGWGGAHD